MIEFFKTINRTGALPGSRFEGNEKEAPLSQSLRATENLAGSSAHVESSCDFNKVSS